MRTIKQSGEHELEVKKSRFRCALARVTDEAEAREFIQQRRKLHHDARHHCSAFVLGDLGEVQKSSDDGEPAGTAGVPMLEVLRHNEVTNAVAVVTRYFGGVLLGAGGLVRAYGGAVSAALEHVGLVERRPVRTVTTAVDYLVAGKLDNDLRSAGYQVVDTEYQDVVRFHINVPVSEVDAFHTWLAEITGGTAQATLGPLTHAEVNPS
ncbi:YigZ family protein [Saccharopolyspora sp. NPDC000359]|uniref:YigZ family protein n=1 Tax=Saccharopolyspora sp. NPDC000359 TaxID=3154251 RepID=UPI00332E8E09